MEPNERARAGIFLAFQRPMAIPGVKMADFLRHATTNVRRPDRKEGEELIPMREFRKELNDKMDQLRMDQIRPPLRERRLFRRRDEAGRDPATGHAAAQVRHPRRDRQRTGRRRRAAGQPEHRRDRRRGDGHPDHHAPRQAARTQPARLHPRDARRTDRRDRRAGTGPRAAQARLRPHSRRVSRSGRGGQCRDERRRSGRRRTRPLRDSCERSNES